MKNQFFRNSLVVGVILLFIGIAVQPSIAVNPISSDNEEDCSICHPVTKLHLVKLKSLINRLEKYDNQLSVISKLNPELEEKYQELSKRITTFKEMNKELKPDYPYPIICNILFILMLSFVFIGGIASIIEYRINPDSDSLLWYLLLPFLLIGEIGPMFWLLLMVELNCIEFPDWLPA